MTLCRIALDHSLQIKFWENCTCLSMNYFEIARNRLLQMIFTKFSTRKYFRDHCAIFSFIAIAVDCAMIQLRTIIHKYKWSAICKSLKEAIQKKSNLNFFFWKFFFPTEWIIQSLQRSIFDMKCTMIISICLYSTTNLSNARKRRFLNQFLLSIFKRKSRNLFV